MIRGVVGVWFSYWGAAYALNLIVSEVIGKKLEPRPYATLHTQLLIVKFQHIIYW